MYCKNCGRPLPDDARFCSYCGTKIEQSAAEQTENIEETKEEETIKVMPPEEKFDWGIESFPGSGIKKTDDIDFDWKIQDGEFKNRPADEPEIAFGEDLQEDKAVADKRYGDEEKQQTSAEEQQLSEENNEEQQPFEKGNEEQQPFEKGNEEQQPSAEDQEKQLQEDETEENKWKKFTAEIPKSSEIIVGPAFDASAASLYGGVKAADRSEETDRKEAADTGEANKEPEAGPEEEIIEGAALEKELFGSEEKLSEEELTKEALENTARIDKFYTFSKKNEEFQKLLDQEYEKFNNGQPMDDEALTQLGEAADSAAAEGMPEDLDSARRLKEMEEARKHFFEDDADDLAEAAKPEDSAGSADTAGQEDTAGPGDEAKPEEKDFSAIAPREDEEPEKKEKDRDRDPGKPEKKKGRAGRVIITILAVILIACLVCIGIRMCAPDSIFSQKLDQAASTVIGFFQGSRNDVTEVETDRTVPADDKTAIIQLQVKKNHNNSIQTIKYSKSAGYSKNDKYMQKAYAAKIKSSAVMKDNLWYKTKNGTQMYLDDSLLGAVISHVSAAADKMTKERMTLLELGDIRRGAGSEYYVWARETTESKADSSGTHSTKKVYIVKVSAEAMKVTGYTEIK